MGCSFLSKPMTEKLSDDQSNDRLCYGVSSMQGWRVSQEDDHNCILDFDTHTSFFAVYDGHGGHEVAQYCSLRLPQFIKDTHAYKGGDLKRALVEGFLGFDYTITTPEVVEILTTIAGENLNEDGSDDEDDIDNLYEEAAMPIEKVIEKYTNLVNPALKKLKKGEFPKSPMLKAKKDVSNVASCSATSSSKPENTDNTKSEDISGASSSTTETKINLLEDMQGKSECCVESNGAVPQIKVSSPDSSESEEAVVNVETPKNDIKPESSQNGDILDEKCKSDSTSSTPQENGEVNSKGKGKATPKKTPKTPAVIRTKRNASQLYKALLNFGHDSEEDDDSEDDDQTFEEPNGGFCLGYGGGLPVSLSALLNFGHDSEEDDDSEDDDQTFEEPNEDSSDEEDEGVNVAIEVDGSEDSTTDEVEDEEEDEEGDEEDDEDDEDDEIGPNKMGGDGFEKPGSDSGCTAVVAVLRGNELYVANAGDSRCIVCRNGTAIEMSLDHKPEDDIERKRIEKAGGKVNWEGRVNGGLNLSRAIGDHSYKQNKELAAEEQMITALPDIKTLTVNPNEDEFMVLACDGIWNFMSSQQVVDFVRPRINTCGDKLSTICEEMFDHCLAPNTFGDGTGCDNMTAIIVRFKSKILKRSASPEPANIDSKRVKTEEKLHIEPTV